jgi:hypothetical protein
MSDLPPSPKNEEEELQAEPAKEEEHEKTEEVPKDEVDVKSSKSKG